MGSSVVISGVPIYVRHDRPAVAAIGFEDGRVAALGAVEDVQAALPHAPVRVLTRGALLPAFVDAHHHAFLVAIDPYSDSLYQRGRDIPSLLMDVRALVDGLPQTSDWLRFHGYQPLRLAEHRSPTAAELDAVESERPMHLITRTYHESSVNSPGLRALGITRDTPDPPGGRIVRDRRGEPTGVLLESASFLAESRSRVHDGEQAWRTRLAAHGRRLLSHGITRIGDAAVPMDAANAVIDELATVGIAAHPLLTGSRIDEPGIVAGHTAKVLADGGEACDLCMSTRQVALVSLATLRAGLSGDLALARAVAARSGNPRRDADGRWHTGIRMPDADRLPGLLRLAADAGSALAVHAVGNGAVDAVLDAVATERVAAVEMRLRVEHAIGLDPELCARLGGSGLPVVAQPGFLYSFGHELTVLPLPRPQRLMPFSSMAKAGTPLVFSSDYPAADISPWSGIAAAVDRRDDTGAQVHPEEAISVAAALMAYTVAGAQVLGAADAGALERGMRADAVWVDRDPHTVDTSALRGTETLATWSSGEQVYAE